MDKQSAIKKAQDDQNNVLDSLYQAGYDQGKADSVVVTTPDGTDMGLSKADEDAKNAMLEQRFADLESKFEAISDKDKVDIATIKTLKGSFAAVKAAYDAVSSIVSQDDEVPVDQTVPVEAPAL